MKRIFAPTIILPVVFFVASACFGASTFTLNPFTPFGIRGDGSIQPGDSIGLSPYTGFNVLVSAPGVTNAWFPNETVQDQRTQGSTNGFNMRGMSWDPISGNIIFIDTHEGSGGTVGGAGAISPYSGIYILDPASGQIIAALSTNGITGGAYTHVCAGVADDGVVYVCNQTTASQTTGFKIYRWPTANTNDPAFTSPPVVAYSNTIGAALGTSGERIGQTMDVRGSGTNTQIILGTSSLNGTGTNIFLFTTTNGTNFAAHRISFPGAITNAVFNDGIAFGPTNTFFTKQVGKPFLYLAYDAAALATNGSQIGGTVISSFAASSVNDPLLNISAIAYDPVNRVLAGLEEIGGTATGGRGKVWLFDVADPTNRAPIVLASRTYIPNFQKTTAPMGYVKFTTNGVLYAQASNNGLLASTVDAVPLSPPTFTTDLPASTRVAEGQTAHFEVLAIVDVTNYQWYSNNVPISGATTYFYDIPNVNTNMSGAVFKVVAFNAAGSATSANSTLTVVSASQFFHPVLLWNVIGTNYALSNPTNFITTIGVGTPASASGTPNERCIAYNALSNQLLVVRGPSGASDFPFLRIFVIDADQGTNGAIYSLNTNGMTLGQNLTLCGIGVSDDGYVYAATAASDTSFKVYMWTNTDPATLPITIFGTNSGSGLYNPLQDLLGGTTFRFGDNLAVHGSGNNTEIVLDSQNSSKFASILRPVADGTMTNWTETGYLLQNTQGSYGSEAYGTTIGRSLEFGPVINTPFGAMPTFWQKRYNGAVGAPLAGMGYTSGGGIAPLAIANTSPGLYTNAAVAINFSLGVAAGINFVGSVGSDNAAQDTLSFYDMTDLSQAVLLHSDPLPGSNNGGHKANGNAIGQVIFGANPVTGTNYIFVINGNNDVAAFVLSGGASPPPKMVVQPRNLRVLQGSSGSMNVSVDQVAAIRWYKGTNSPVDTGITGIAYNINNAALTDGGDYFVIATNINGAVTSTVAHVTVSLPNDNYTLTQAWAANPTNATTFPYVTTDGGPNTPNERAFAYNALSNQLVVVRCPPASTAFKLWVVDGTTGSNLYNLNTTGVIHEGASEVSGSNPVDLVGATASDDGSIYVCSETPNASGGAFADTTKMFHIYRWTNTAPSTPAVLVFEGDPSGQPAGINLRWGDVLTARGGGTNTELFLNSFDGSYAAVMKPTDATLNAFTNLWFSDSAGGGSIGRSVQFGPTNTVFEKRKGSPLVFSRYDTNTQTSSSSLQVDSSTTLGGVAVDLPRNLAIGVDFVGSGTKPDAVALYDITDPTTPMLINRYNFPNNQVANANVICQTVISGDRVFSLDANNGLIAFNITPPANSQPMILNITLSGANVNLSWANSSAILQGSPTLDNPSWTDLTTAGQTSSVQPINSPNQFYRLRR